MIRNSLQLIVLLALIFIQLFGLVVFTPQLYAKSDLKNYDMTFVVPDKNYLEIEDESIIISKIKFYKDSTNSSFTIFDYSKQFVTYEELNETDIEKIAKQNGYNTVWNDLSGYNVLICKKHTKSQYITEYYFATGKFGYLVVFISPLEKGYNLDLEKNNITIIDTIKKPILSGRSKTIKCDICVNTIKKGGYLVDSDTVLKSDNYIDWYINYHKKQGNISKDIIVDDQIRDVVRSQLSQAVGNSPWLICDDCMATIFINLLKNEKQALHYRIEATKFWKGMHITNEEAKYNP